MAATNNFQLKSEVYPVKPTHHIPVSQTDWDRLRRIAKKMRSYIDWRSILASFILGVFGNALVVWFTRSYDKDNPKVTAALISVMIITGIAGVILLVISICMKVERNMTGDDLLKEMEIIEGTLQKED